MTDTAREQADIIQRLDKAERCVFASCAGRRPLRMSIPANPREDEDLLIVDACRDARIEIESLRYSNKSLADEAATLRAENQRLRDELAKAVVLPEIPEGHTLRIERIAKSGPLKFVVHRKLRLSDEPKDHVSASGANESEALSALRKKLEQP